MTLSVALFYTLAVLTGLCAISVVVTQNIVRAAAWLLFTLAGVAGLLFLLGAQFVGATQLLVYVGGTLVLVVFGVMLTAQGPFISMKSGAAEWGVATVVGVMLYGVLAVALISRPPAFEQPRGSAPGQRPQASALGLRFLGFDESAFQAPQPAPAATTAAPPSDEMTDTTTLGLSLLGFDEATPPATFINPSGTEVPRRRVSYLLPFEIVSVHLLVVLIGAAYLARAKRRRNVELDPNPKR